MADRTFRVNPTPSILIVDDNQLNVQLLTEILKRRGYQVQCAASGGTALHMAFAQPPDLIVLDIRMPDIDGFEVCRQFKSFEAVASIPIIFVSGLDEPIDKVKAFAAGGVDYVTKPFHAEEILARVGTHLRLRQLQRELERQNWGLQKLVQDQVTAIIESHLATIFALAKLAEYRDDDTGKHVQRVQNYCQVLAMRLGRTSTMRKYIDDKYVQNLMQTAALHDIGKVGIPDSVLLKPGPLDEQERQIMENHTTIGAATLEEVLQCHPGNRFIKMGVGIARSHHEKWDGSGYPDGLTEEAIPLSARILTMADHYDALRNSRPYKTAIDHPTTCEIIVDGDGRTQPSHFDPLILHAFKEAQGDFARVFDRFRDSAIAV